MGITRKSSIFVAREAITTWVMPTFSPSSKIHLHTLLQRFSGTKLLELGFPVFCAALLKGQGWHFFFFYFNSKGDFLSF